ncbi:unnamed protein product [Spirodela intermedia]|uniref:Uncharacterized protein n=1 Tax=Spirodela intermedia TaxID=51605 RepID=A0A7I8IAS1_SPIIN|nr:unnamed protein product [Spirodela intermedia]CAA6654785.1 unnamed protein product [Spirodela intermedia]
MEVSLENRLPEADSLPDGFVESSAEPQLSSFSPVPPPVVAEYKDSLLDADCGPVRRSSDLLFDEVSVVDQVESAVRVVASPSCIPENDKNVGAPVVRRTYVLARCRDLSGLHAINSKPKEISADERPECPTNQKLDASEAKRKAGKRNVKSGKESSEFNLLRYQKVIAERDAAIVVRERLESLCRELQRQNKLLMDECKRVSTEGQNVRSEFSKKFNDAIEDVSKKLEMQKEESLAQLKENELLRNKLTHLTEQYALSEQAFGEKLKQKMLELQLADLKIQQHQERTAQEQTQKELYVEQVSQLLETEKSLRLQLAADGEKFQQFQVPVIQTLPILLFETFNKEMKKMTKLVKDLKKENISLKTKCEEQHFSIAKLLSERESMKKELDKATRQKENLESLCRSLQTERKQNCIRTDSEQENP